MQDAAQRIQGGGACAIGQEQVSNQQQVAGPAKHVEPKTGCDAQPQALKTREWDVSSKLQILEATTARYRVTWTVRGHNCFGDWPRTYDFKPDCEGWISDSFIKGGCDGLKGRVSWNVRTNEVRVDGHAGAKALELARFAKTTIFPGIDLGTLAR